MQRLAKLNTSGQPPEVFLADLLGIELARRSTARKRA